ncbi:MAG TPA: ATP-grasp domain-containing protein [Kofleriaceae bacterium]|nr:ATP-grasp domain-containing protein [Kofleriaceae bacterium]
MTRTQDTAVIAPPLTWLVQANMRDQHLRQTVETALDGLGEHHHGVSLVPFSREVPALPFAPDERRIVCMGPSFVPRIASETAWRPGIYFDAATFRWSVMAEHWRDLMFTPDGEITTAREVLAELETSGPLFIRPDEDSKAFDGGTYADASTLRSALGSTDGSLVVVRGRVTTVDAEWRCFVVGGQIVDASEYRRAGRPSFHRGAPPRVLDLVDAAIARWSPAPVTCVDVASSGAHFGIVEVNCFNAARFYAADPGTVLAAVAAHVRTS